MARIKLKNSQVKDKVPQPTDLDVGGELAVNHHADNPGIFLKDTAGNIRKIAGPGNIAHLWIDGGSAVSNFGSAPALINGGAAA